MATMASMASMASRLLIVLLCGVLSPAAAAQGAPASEPTVSARIARGEALIEALEYEEAAEELMLVVGDPRSTDEELLRANLLAGVANRVLDRNVEARLNFHYVLTRAPATQLPPDTAPKITSFFELVRREVEAERPAPAPAPDEALPASTAAPSPAPVDPAPIEEDGVGAIFWTGAVILGVSAALTGLFVAGTVTGELVLNIAAVPGETKGLFAILGQSSLLLLLLTPLGLIGGGTLLGWGLLE